MPKSEPQNGPSPSFIEAFSFVPDPRSSKSRRHPLINIIVIAYCGVLCGADNWVAIETWAKAKRTWLEGFLDLSNGVPSHDTFGRVFSILSPDAMQRAFVTWTRGLDVDLQGRVVAIDGKTMRRSHDRSRNRSPVHMVNAWCTEAGVALGQVATDQKSNEITAIPQLLETLFLKGAIVTLDAMGCQRNIAAAIRARDADYILAAKGNQPKLLEAIQESFDDALEQEEFPDELTCFEEEESGHGRRVRRTVWVLPVPKKSELRELWADLNSMVFIESYRAVGDKESMEHRFYISSLQAQSSADMHARAIRAHWGVENGLHWVLDIAFREDESRVRIGHAAENMARLRQMSLNVLKQEKTLKVGIKNKRLRAGWDDAYLELLLGGVAASGAEGDVS